MTIARTLSQLFLNTASAINFLTIAPGTSNAAANAGAATLSSSAGDVRIAPPSGQNTSVALTGNGQMAVSGGAVVKVPATISPSATITPDLRLGNTFTIALATTATTTIANPTSVTTSMIGQTGYLIFTQPASGALSLLTSWGTSYRFQGGVVPALTQTFSAVDVFSYVIVSTTLIIVSPISTGKQSINNVVIGGDFSMNPWQRGTSFALTNSPAYTADRFQAYRVSGTANATVSQLATATVADTGYQFAMRIQRTNADTNVGAIQAATSLEISTCRRLAGRTVTLAVRARAGANLSGTCVLSLFTGTGTADASRLSGPYTGDANPVTFDLKAGLTTSWTELSTTFTLASTVTQFSLIYIHTPAGTAGAADYVDFEIIQLEDSPYFTGWGFKDKATTLRECQRYLPAYVATINTALWSGQAYGTTTAYVCVQFPVTTRAPPTGMVATPGNFLVASATTVSSPTCTAISLQGGTTNTAEILLTVGSGLVAGNATGLIVSSAATILFTGCELGG